MLYLVDLHGSQETIDPTMLNANKPKMQNPEVLIVGGGIAGLCCARHLHQSGVPSRILESADEVGGRVRTERYRGFRLDHGFQVLLTEYPEAKKILDYEELQLRNFEPGAMIRFGGKFHRFVDPWRKPQHIFETALSPVASFADKLRVAGLRRRVCRGRLEEHPTGPETSTLERLYEEGFSNRIIERFFKPFLGGVFLENELNTSSRKFEFVFRMFSQGDAAIPAHGMGEITKQLAAGLPPENIETNAKVIHLGPNQVRLEDGRELPAASVVVACQAPVASRLLNEKPPDPHHGVTCLYFSADSPPLRDPILILNGEGRGPINNLCVPSQVAPEHAPKGKSLISVTVLGSTDLNKKTQLRDEVFNQLRTWFGSTVDDWDHLKTYNISYALPSQNPASPDTDVANRRRGIIRCGDYMGNASIQGAMVSGRRAAETILGSQSHATPRRLT